jgi:hypothetical protein
MQHSNSLREATPRTLKGHLDPMYSANPVPAGIRRPMMTFSFNPRR